jgi:energy-coupling factor transport system ATP-binding protein
MEIKFNDVSFSYHLKTPLEKEVLKNIDLEIKNGKITGIIGKSGSGKSTMIQLINALNFPTKGNLEVGTFVIDSKKKKIKKINELRVNIGLIFQFPEEQFFNMTVFDEISFGMKYFKFKTEDIEKRIINALKMVGLNKDYLYRNPFTLSSGEKRKIANASILAYNPSILILDEPTIGLDSISKKKLLELIRTLKNRYKKTIILVSHDVDLVHQISDQILVLSEGKIVLSGNKYDVFKHEIELKKYGIKLPKAIEFSNLVYKKTGKKIGYRDDINDILKDVYRNAR